MAILNIKGFPDDLYEALRERASAEHRSIAQEVVHLLSGAVLGADDGYRTLPPVASFVAEPVAVYDAPEVTLTAEARQRLGVRPGARVELAIDGDGRLVATPVARRDLREMRGLLKALRPVSVDAMAETVRQAGTRL